MPPHIQQYCARTKSLFNDYEYKFWTNENMPDMPELCMKQFNRYGKKGKIAFQADVLRYYLLNKYGGIYLDVDFVCNKRFDGLIKKKFFCVSPNGRVFHVCNGIFACEANNPILTKLLSELKDESYHGPLLFTKYISEYLGVQYRTHLFNYLQENPNSYVQCASATDFFSKKLGYCYHDALHSWSNKKRKK